MTLKTKLSCLHDVAVVVAAAVDDGLKGAAKVVAAKAGRAKIL